MSGLVGYDSSDEEDVVPQLKSSGNSLVNIKSSSEKEDVEHPELESRQQPREGSNGDQASPAIEGPVLGPSIPDEAANSVFQDEGPPSSPYTANRASLRNLTLPTTPNYDIPQSPPGSPVESTNAKFKQFLKLKKQGVHFNEKLATSAAMKNPSLMQKLLDFAEIDEVEQYSTTLPKELWDPSGFPEFAFKEELSRSQQDLLRKKEADKSRGQRASVDFVSATSSTNTSRNGTPGSLSRAGPKSAAERIMAGLDRGRSNSPQTQGVKRKTRFDT